MFPQYVFTFQTPWLPEFIFGLYDYAIFNQIFRGPNVSACCHVHAWQFSLNCSVHSASEMVHMYSKVHLHECVKKWVWQCTKTLLFFFVLIYTARFQTPYFENMQTMTGKLRVPICITKSLWYTIFFIHVHAYFKFNSNYGHPGSRCD